MKRAQVPRAQIGEQGGQIPRPGGSPRADVTHSPTSLASPIDELLPQLGPILSPEEKFGNGDEQDENIAPPDSTCDPLNMTSLLLQLNSVLVPPSQPTSSSLSDSTSSQHSMDPLRAFADKSQRILTTYPRGIIRLTDILESGVLRHENHLPLVILRHLLKGAVISDIFQSVGQSTFLSASTTSSIPGASNVSLSTPSSISSHIAYTQSIISLLSEADTIGLIVGLLKPAYSSLEVSKPISSLDVPIPTRPNGSLSFMLRYSAVSFLEDLSCLKSNQQQTRQTLPKEPFSSTSNTTSSSSSITSSATGQASTHANSNNNNMCIDLIIPYISNLWTFVFREPESIIAYVVSYTWIGFYTSHYIVLFIQYEVL